MRSHSGMWLVPCLSIVETLDVTQETLAGEVDALSVISVLAATGVDDGCFSD